MGSLLVVAGSAGQLIAEYRRRSPCTHIHSTLYTHIYSHTVRRSIAGFVKRTDALLAVVVAAAVAAACFFLLYTVGSVRQAGKQTMAHRPGTAAMVIQV